jgi:hypothetical protein
MMTQYVKALDIWPLPPRARAALQPGQWVTAGPNGPRGQYLGQRPGGTDVVAWAGNCHGRNGYIKTLRNYARKESV